MSEQDKTLPDTSRAHGYLAKLPGYYIFMRNVSTVVLAGFFFLIYLLPYEYTPFISDHYGLLVSMAILLAVSILCFFLVEWTEEPFVGHALSLAWSLFYLYLVFVTGGVASPFTLLLAFPVFTIATLLNERLVLIFGAINATLLAATLFLGVGADWTGSDVFLGFTHVILYIVIVLYLYSIVRETLRHKYEKDEANKKYFQIAETDRVKADFVTVVSHQLRTPLTGARYALTTYEDTADPQAKTALVKEAEKRIGRSIGIVDDMLKSFESGAGGTQKDWTHVDAMAVMRAVVEDMKYETKKTGTSMRVSGPVPAVVFGDENLLHVAIAHVLENAVRYSPGGLVIIALERKGADLHITITDNGIGITPDDQLHIFERFFRGKNAIHTAPNESGLGLFTAKQIIRRHGGNIELVSSEAGKGTAMRIILPCVGDEVPAK